MSNDLHLVNSHCLDNLLAASEHSNFHVAEDIYNSKGMKLLSAGHEITPRIRDKLISQKLTKPFETSIASSNSVTTLQLSLDAVASAKKNQSLVQLFPLIDNEAKLIVDVNLQPFPVLLLTVIRDNGSGSYEHTLLMALLSILIARELNLDQRTIKNIITAALLHDIGELYVPRDFLYSSKSLSAQEWKNVMVHPLIGYKVISEHMHYDQDVSVGVFEHHERCDGTGYPRKINESSIGLIGNILMVTEALAGMLAKPDSSMTQALLIMRVFPHEYPIQIVNALHSLVIRHKVANNTYVHNTEVTSQQISIFVKSVNKISNDIQALLDIVSDNTDKEIIENLSLKFAHLHKAIAAVGFDCFLNDPYISLMENDALIEAEVNVSSREIAWRVKDMARDTLLEYLNSDRQPPIEIQAIINQMISISV